MDTSAQELYTKAAGVLLPRDGRFVCLRSRQIYKCLITVNTESHPPPGSFHLINPLVEMPHSNNVYVGVLVSAIAPALAGPGVLYNNFPMVNSVRLGVNP